LNDKKIILNAELIESVESTPDTVITLTNGKKIIVKEGCQEVKNLVLSYKRNIIVNWSENLQNHQEDSQ
jgi:flagellar protein FlbD